MAAKWFGRMGMAALVLGAACSSGAVVGCAEEREPINRVQGNVIPKSFLVGEKYSDPSDDPEFYARTMVIDVPYGESGSDFLMFTNTINSVSKIKWGFEGTNGEWLVGRISFERFEGTDGKGTAKATDAQRDPSLPVAQNDGIVVYQFKVESHFDIRRSYNSATGEEQNVLEENATDRRWEDRDYVRIDFSENKVTAAYDFDTLSLLGVYNGIEYTSAPLFVENPKDPQAPVIDVDNSYFDVTNKVFAQPKMLDLGGWVIPGCMLPNIIGGGTEPVGNCNPNELTLRHSFRRVVDKDYEPVNWDGFRFEAYGAFTTTRNGYARDYGAVDAKWKRYISRYNIWERAHYYQNPEAMTGAISCKVDSECQPDEANPNRGVSPASHCDTYNEKCTLPYSQRKAKPVIWHYADGSPALYYEATREAAEEWDAAMRVAVAGSRSAECQRFGLDPEKTDCGLVLDGNFAEEEDVLFLVKQSNACNRGELPLAQGQTCAQKMQQIGESRGYAPEVAAVANMPQMVILCHSPVDAKDPAVCGKEGTVARLGDLRFNLVTNIAKPETNSPWGIMSDGNDPVTGEKVAASINVWTHVNDLFSRGLVDTLRYIGGELKTEDITDGKYVNAWVEAARSQAGAGMTPLMSQDERDKRVAAVAGTTVEGLHAGAARWAAAKQGTDDYNLKMALKANLEKVRTTKASWDAPSVNAPLYAARANMLKGTAVEAEAITPAMQQLASAQFGQIAVDNQTKTQATSIFQGLNPAIRRGYEQRMHMALAARGACIMPFEATAPIGYVALGDILQQKFGNFNPGDDPRTQAERADRMKDYIRRRAQYAVIAHEMGHSFALRHNFVSSSDAWNFRPQYWALRTNAKKTVTKCADTGTQDGKTCVGERWLDPVTPNESKNIIHMWAQSSTMEYPGEPTQDMLGLGMYDFGAARMFYGDAATVYPAGGSAIDKLRAQYAIRHQDDFGGLIGLEYTANLQQEGVHYSQLASAVNLIEGCSTDVNTDAFRPENWDEQKNGIWSPMLDGHIVTNEEGQPVRCTQPKVNYAQWSSLNDQTIEYNRFKPASTGDAGTRVPHGFASDDWADLGNIAVFRHDNGADLYETMQFWIAQQEMTHIFTNYRRGRRDFSIWGAFQRTLSRYHEKMRDSAKALALFVTIARDTVSQYGAGSNPNDFVAQLLNQFAPNTLASSIAFDHFTHVFARPQPGDHATFDATGLLKSTESTGFTSPPTTALHLNIANGVQGGYGNISLGGRPVENALANNTGRDYDRDFTLNVGSYYEKAFTAYLFAESADNFISANRDDFIDPRFRSVSLADVFPDGYRRWIANNLTGDEMIKGVAIRGTGGGSGTSAPDLDPNDYATLGTTSWWPTGGMEYCFPQGERLQCGDPKDPLHTKNAAGVSIGGIVDPEVGWEQQKFATLFSLLYLPENNRLNWVDQFSIYQLGPNSDPGFDNRIEFHDVQGRVFIARTFGTETLFGKTVQKGIGARILEYANELLQKSTDVDVVKGKTATWYVPKADAVTGQFKYKSGNSYVDTCDKSAECTKLQNYMAVPRFLRDAMYAFGWTRNWGELKGVY